MIIKKVVVLYDPGEYILTRGHKKNCRCKLCRAGGYRGYGWAGSLRLSELKLRIWCGERRPTERDIQSVRDALYERFGWKKLNARRVGLFEEAVRRVLVGKEMEEIDFEGFFAICEELAPLVEKDEKKKKEEQRERNKQRRKEEKLADQRHLERLEERIKLEPQLRQLWIQRALAQGYQFGEFKAVSRDGKTDFECRARQENMTFVYVLPQYQSACFDPSKVVREAFKLDRKIFESAFKEVWVVRTIQLGIFERPGDIDLVKSK